MPGLDETVNIAGAFFYYHNELPCLKVGEKRYELGQEQLDSLLNLLKIPTKYLQRLASEDYSHAMSNVNLWLAKKSHNISLAMRGDEVVHVVEAARSFVPSKTVINALSKYLGCKRPLVSTEGELVVALFKADLPDIELDSGETGFFSIRLTYSECFIITPKIDAVLTINRTFENYYYPIQQRKFRLAKVGEAQVINAVIEFTDIVLDQIQKEFVPALNKMMTLDARLNIYGFVQRLCSELRLSKKLCLPLIEGIDETEVDLHRLVRLISNNLLPEVRVEAIDHLTAREIEIALSKAIVSGRFK